jgi:hypothetical protein
MKTFDQVVLPLSLLFAGTIGGIVADRAARLRRPHGDRGDYWARVVQRVCLFLALPVLVSGALVVFPTFWQTGRHLHFDLTGVFGWSIPMSYRIALLLPHAVWAALLAYGLIEPPGGRDAGRWLAGAIGFGNSRLWVLAWTLPLAAILASSFSNLGGGADAFPAVAWGTLAVLLLSLVGVALSIGHAVAAAVPAYTKSEPRQAPALRPWPEALAAHGVQLKPVASWPATSERTRRVKPGAARDLEQRLRLRGARNVAPQLIEAVEGLFGAGNEEENRSRVIYAPDDCGQAEVVALAAELLDQRFHAATLVVVASDASSLAAELARWLPADRTVEPVQPTGEIAPDALVIVADAQTLSDHLLPKLKDDPQLLRRFGLIIWWHLEAYTGVLAANLWAISRRLHRLLEAMGRHDVRTMAFVRNVRHGDAQVRAFVRRLLPHPLPTECEVPVHPYYPRDIHLHVLESHAEFFSRPEGRNIQPRHRHLPLVTAKVSVEENWPTFLELPPDISGDEADASRQFPVGDETLGERLQPVSASAGARIRRIQAGEILSLPEIVGQGGRATTEGLAHHVGLTLPPNPYVSYLLSTLAEGDGAFGFTTSRRLVSTEAQPNVVRRHLLLALDELPDTRHGLLKNFLWKKEVIQQTLDEIANEGKLTSREVRFLDDNRDLQREPEYKSQRLPAGEHRPLDTVGMSLIEVRDPAAGHEPGGGVRMRVDPERLTIQAYPHRVFMSGGQRYRIREWSSPEEVVKAGRIECDRQGIYCWTWRIRNAEVLSIKSDEAPVGIGRDRRLLTRLAASVEYHEVVNGCLRVTPDLTTGVEPKPETDRLARAIERKFATQALILRFPEDREPVALASLAQALRDLLPVHLGVEEDALEVVPLTGELVQGRAAFGLAIVDLYPGGIGLVDAIADDNPFLLKLLEWARDWLANCPCKSDQGCARCLRTPSAKAANRNQPLFRSAALELLEQVV